MKNYQKVSIFEENRVELHDKLNLTGAEVSINILPAGTAVPFVHYHKHNEEIYGILEGKGKLLIDNEEVDIQKGDWLRISPRGKRQISASSDSLIKYICIQVSENSLDKYTVDDAIIE